MFDRISRSWSLAMSSFQVMKTNKKLIMFPVFSGLALLIVLISFAVPIGIIAHQGGLVDQNGKPQIWVYPVVFLFYFCNYFVIVFCNCALTSCALLRLNGETPTIGDGFSAAFARLPQIAAWALVSATVGLILKAIENANEKVGQFISSILGTVWSIVTYFVIPILVVEKVGPFEAIKRSGSILRKTWGEALVGNIGLGLLMFLLAIPGILLFLVGIYVAATANLVAVGITVVILAVLYFIGLSLVSSTLHSIYLAALYQYAAHDRVPEGFDRESFAGAFTPKKASA